MIFEPPDIDPKLLDEWVIDSDEEWDAGTLKPGAPDDVVAAFAVIQQQMEYQKRYEMAMRDPGKDARTSTETHPTSDMPS